MHHSSHKDGGRFENRRIKVKFNIYIIWRIILVNVIDGAFCSDEICDFVLIQSSPILFFFNN